MNDAVKEGRKGRREAGKRKERGRERREGGLWGVRLAGDGMLVRGKVEVRGRWKEGRWW